MRRYPALSAFALSLSLATSIAAPSAAGGTGEQKRPNPPAVSEKKQKPPICEWICVQWNDNGSCAKQEYQCR